MQQQNFTPLYPPLQVRAGVLVVDGFGINRNRAVAVSEVHRRNREWKRHGSDKRDQAWFAREVVPNLNAFSLKAIGDATGLSLAACSRIRAGVRIPHPRHWDALLALVKE